MRCRAVVYLKLSLVMGGPWLLSYLAESFHVPWILVLVSACNSLQGVLVFLIFACNRNVFTLVRRALQRRRRQPAKADRETRQERLHPRLQRPPAETTATR